MNFWDRTKVQIDSQNTTFRWLSDRLVIPESTMSRWRATGNIPGAEIALAIATLLGVSVEYLVTGKDHTTPEIRPAEREIIGDLRYLTDAQLETVLVQVHALAEKNRIVEKTQQTAG